MNRILFLADLDHNLFQSHRVDPEGLHPMTVDKAQKPHCFATQAQRTLLSLMAANAFCVAVTARTPDQMMRVTGWNTTQEHDLALTDLGKTLMYRHKGDDWQIIDEWSSPYLAEASAIALQLKVDFEQFKDILTSRAYTSAPENLSFTLNYCHESPEVPYYFLVKQAKKSAGMMDLETLRNACAKFMSVAIGEYFYHESEGTISLWPTYVSKYIAVERLMTAFTHGLDDERFENARLEKGRSDLVISSGDSLSDLPFMQIGHFWMAPAVSQISEQLMPDQIMPFTPSSYNR